MSEQPVSDRFRVRRIPHKGRYDQDTIYRVLDDCLFAHVAYTDGDQPLCIPMLHARIDNELLLHGSTASRTMRLLASGVPACVTATALHGLVIARSSFENSANYESVAVFGSFRPVNEDRMLPALEAFSEKLLPGRWAEARPPHAKELKATSIVAMPIENASAKVSSGPPDDDDSPDAELDIWAGVIPLITRYGEPEPSPGLRPGIPVPPSVRDLSEPSA